MRKLQILALLSAWSCIALAHASFTIPGAFDVAATGAATYSIPIQVAPGVAGMEPKLALHYNSHAGSGWMGPGWSVGGLSSIHRCRRTLAQDGVRGGVNYDTNDRFCLDGQRLMVINGADGGNGSEYRTERESFSRISSHGTAGSGPAYFIVKTRSGLTHYYGESTDSRIEAAQGGTTAITWALTRTVDTRGNQITYHYTEDNANGQWYPSEVRYAYTSGGVFQAKLIFEYEAEPHPIKFFHAGRSSRRSSRLSKLAVEAGSERIREYRLAYSGLDSGGRYTLDSVTQCGVGGADCLLPISFSWTPEGAPTFQHWSSHSPQYGSYAANQHHFADVNGDGRSDLIRIYRNSNVASVALAGTDGAFQHWTAHTNFVGPVNEYAHYFVDVNGDGKSDLIQVDRHNVDYAWLGLSNGDGTFQHWTSVLHTGSIAGYEHHFVDVNGDGLPDWIQINRLTNNAWVGLNQGNGAFQIWTSHTTMVGSANAYAHYFHDLNGDGKADWIQVHRTSNLGWVGLSNGDGTFQHWTNHSYIRGSVNGYEHYFADVNGDGHPDWIQVHRVSNNGWTGLGNGDGTFQHWTAHTASVGSVDAFSHYFHDVNGDGRADWIQVHRTSDLGWVGLSNGDGTFQHWTNYSYIRGKANGYEHHFHDVNGDGRPDWIQLHRDSDNGWVGLNLSGSSRMILGILNGTASTNLTYNTLPRILGARYLKEFSVSYPEASLVPALPVVTDVAVSDGLGGQRLTHYWYGTAIFDYTGRGFKGFNWLQSQDSTTQLISRTWYHYGFPYTGLRSASYVWTPAWTPLSQTDYTYDCVQPGTSSACSVAPAQRYFVRNPTTVERKWDLNGVALPQTHTTRQFDAYGNATQITEQTHHPAGGYAGYSKTTTNVYANDTTNWLLGLLLRSTVTSTTP